MYRNVEGYPDPTAGEALAAVMRMERDRQRALTLKAADMVLRNQPVRAIAGVLGCCDEEVVCILNDLKKALDRATEVCK